MPYSRAKQAPWWCEGLSWAIWFSWRYTVHQGRQENFIWTRDRQLEWMGFQCDRLPNWILWKTERRKNHLAWIDHRSRFFKLRRQLRAWSDWTIFESNWSAIWYSWRISQSNWTTWIRRRIERKLSKNLRRCNWSYWKPWWNNATALWWCSSSNNSNFDNTYLHVLLQDLW